MNGGLAAWFGPKRFQPDPGYSGTTDHRLLAGLVGVVALALPFIMIVAGHTQTCFHDSISHFYYTPIFGDVLVLAMGFIAGFLVTYRGESNRENWLATFAGISALIIALLPTEEDGCEKGEFPARILAHIKSPTEPKVATGDACNDCWFTSDQGFEPLQVLLPEPLKMFPVDEAWFFQLFETVGFWHGLAAAFMFAFLAYFTLFVFTRTIRDKHRRESQDECDPREKLKPKKLWRNVLYYICGGFIVTSMLAIFVNFIVNWDQWDELNMTFWFEAIALWSFGLSWMVKGRWFFGRYLRDPEEKPA